MEILLGIAFGLSIILNLFLVAALTTSEEVNRDLKTKLMVTEQLLKMEKRDKE